MALVDDNIAGASRACGNHSFGNPSTNQLLSRLWLQLLRSQQAELASLQPHKQQSQSSSSSAPKKLCGSSWTWEREQGRVESGRAVHRVVQPRVLSSGPMALSAAPRGAEMDFLVCKPHTRLTSWSLLNFSWALINADPRGTTLATSPCSAPCSPVLQPMLFPCSRLCSHPCLKFRSGSCPRKGHFSPKLEEPRAPASPTLPRRRPSASGDG